VAWQACIYRGVAGEASGVAGLYIQGHSWRGEWRGRPVYTGT